MSSIPTPPVRGCRVMAILLLVAPLVLSLLVPPLVHAQEADRAEELIAAARESVVVITFAGRQREGLGTGFVLREDGLIATNWHVLGLARPITVRTADGTTYPVEEIHASNRPADLAVLKVDAEGLTPLPLGDSRSVRQGQEVVAIGNPLGLNYSATRGVISAKRVVDGQPTLQLAMPVERGNSGGPLLDMDGKVVGIVNKKSLATANLSFAVPIELLEPLLDEPNTITMEHWLNIGRLDPAEWTVLFGANWYRRPGRILVEQAGNGFGGRSLCLSQREVPEPPYEVAVRVKLEEEEGAAGLVFGSDGADRHYGFYPSGGRLRLTRFDGPTVFTWNVLAELDSPHYRTGEWNTLKVRLTEDEIVAFVNDREVVRRREPYRAGKVGLCKFRDTEAAFRGFALGRELAPTGPTDDEVALIASEAERLDVARPPLREVVDAMPPARVSLPALREQARILEQRAERLRELARGVHTRDVLARLAEVTDPSLANDKIDLLEACLLIARLDDEDVDVAGYVDEFGRLAAELRSSVPADASAQAKRQALHEFLFREQGFHGNQNDYYSRGNSYLSSVLEDRTGLPITLSVLYMELARQIGLEVEGVGLPGHFVVRHRLPAGGGDAPSDDDVLIDVFAGGTVLSRDAAELKVLQITGSRLRDEHLAAVDKRSILYRMLRNLIGVANQEGDVDDVLRYLDAVLVVRPEAGEERVVRAMLRYQTGRRPEAIADLDWLLERRPPDIDLDRVAEMRARFLQQPG